MTATKWVLLFLGAYALGAFTVYSAMSQLPRTTPNEEWGVVVVHFSRGPGLWGLFESKAECLRMRQAYRAIYADIGRSADEVKREPSSRTLILEGQIPVTFSCLPLSEIRGLALDHAGPTK